MVSAKYGDYVKYFNFYFFLMNLSVMHWEWQWAPYEVVCLYSNSTCTVHVLYVMYVCSFIGCR